MRPVRFFCLILAMALLLPGCARYARTVALVYQPVASVQGGTGEVYIVISPEQRIQAGNVKWVIGTVKDDEGNKVDEIYSPQSPAEVLQNALGQELKQAGYKVMPTVARAQAPAKEIILTNAEVRVDQDSTPLGLKATCRIVMGLELWSGDQQLKRVTYETRYSDTNIKDRDLLAKSVLQESLQAVMRKAVPELVDALERK